MRFQYASISFKCLDIFVSPFGVGEIKKEKTKIQEFNQWKNSDENNIFEIPDLKEFVGGIVFFTNVTRFEAILKGIKINGKSILDFVNFGIAKFKEDEIIIESISNKNVAKKPYTFIFSRQDAYLSFFNIVGSNSLLSKFNTIVVDDFDEIIRSKIRKDDLNTCLSFFNDEYTDSLKQGKISNIYLLNKRSSIGFKRILEELNFSTLPVLFN